MLFILIFIQIILPVLSVFIYERLRGYTLSVLKRITLYLCFIIASAVTGYAALSVLRGEMYHDWLFTELLSISGLFIRLAIPLVSAAVMPFAVYFYIKAADYFFKVENFDKKPLKHYAHCSLAVFTVCFVTFVFAPSYMSVAVEEVLQNTVLITVTVIITGAALVIGSVVFLFQSSYRYVEVFLTGLLLLCFLNAFIIPFQAEVLDGRQELVRVIDDPMPLVRSILIFIACACLSIVFRSQLRFTSIPLILIALVFTFINISTMSNRQAAIDESNRDQEMKIEDATTLSLNRNVVVIVLDMLQGTIAERTLIEYPQLRDSYDGFTIFTRAFSSFSFTTYSQGVIQTGNLYSSDELLFRDSNIHTFPDSFMSDMRDKGAKVNLLGNILHGERQNDFPFVRRITTMRPWVLYSSVSSAALARITGYWMSLPLGSLLPEEAGDGETPGVAWVIDRTLESIDTMEMLIDNLSVSDEQDRLLYLWNMGTHLPALVKKDGSIDISSPDWNKATEQGLMEEAYFFLSQIDRLFDVMRELDVFDDSLIIVLSDHGAAFPNAVWEEHKIHAGDFLEGAKYYGNFNKVQGYNTVIMIKPPNSFGEAVITHDNAWCGDIRALINHYYDDLSETPDLPVDVIAEIRAKNPEVGVMFAPRGLASEQIKQTRENHEILYVTTLYDIAAAFSAHSGIADS